MWKNEVEKMDLFEDILKQINAEFLSDIKSEQYRDAAIKCALNIENEKHPQTEWLDLIKYLTLHEATNDVSIDQIKVSLRNTLTASKQKRKKR